MNKILLQALEYREHGLSCLPINDYRKTPAIKEWKNLQDKVQTENEVENLFAHHGGNIAFIAGSASNNLVCLDIEEKELFEEWRDEFVSNYGDTWMIISRRGGHILFRTPQTARSRSYKQDGYEILGQGHYHLAPPSRFMDGDETYSYEFVSKPDKIAIVEHETFFPLEFVNLEDEDCLEPVLRPLNDNLTLELALAEVDRLALNMDRFRGVGGEIDKSRFDMSVIQTLVNQGAASEIIREALYQANIETHYQKLWQLEGKYNADKNFDFSYKKAAKRGDTAEYLENQELAEKAMVLALSRKWDGRTGTVDKDAFLAHVKKFSLCKKRPWNISYREGARLGEMTDRTFGNGTNRLIVKGYLNKVGFGSRLKLEPASYDFGTEWIDMVHNYSYTHGISNVCTWEDKQLKQIEMFGVFERVGGLGKAAKNVYDALGEAPMKKAQLAQKTGRHRSTISRVVEEMEQYGIVEEIDGLVNLVNGYDFKALAEELGTTEISKNRKRQHDEDRMRQLQLLKSKKIQFLKSES